MVGEARAAMRDLVDNGTKDDEREFRLRPAKPRARREGTA